jgi:hypothetical protein
MKTLLRVCWLFLRSYSWSVFSITEIRKPTDLSQATNKIYHIMLYTNQNAVVIGINCIGSYKSNYHTITTTTASLFFLHIECMKLEQNRKQQVGKYKISEMLIIIECLQIKYNKVIIKIYSIMKIKYK